MRTTKKDIISLLKLLNCSSIQVIEDNSIMVDDILKEIDYEYFDINIDMEQYKKLDIIAIIETCPLLKDKCFETDIVYMYVLIDDNVKNVYIAIDYLHPYLWNKFGVDTIDEIMNKIRHAIRLYSSEVFYENELSCTMRRFIGTEKTLGLKFETLEEFIMENKFCEYFMWGSNWSDFPYRENILNKKYSKFQVERMMTRALKQNNQDISISTRTKSSKSIITFEYINGAVILTVKYNKDFYTRTSELEKITDNKYPSDLPLDVIGIIYPFDVMNYDDLLMTNELTISNISLSLELVDNEESMRKVSSILSQEIKQELSEDTIKFINDVKTKLNINLRINEMKEDIYNILEKDENSEVLLQWLKNKLNTGVNNDDVVMNNHLVEITKTILNKYKKLIKK
ncbi:hypothetical protein Catovirus_2_128 [Catovirus CTV1]|uniref:Uncharacterized protein n=1 Tax=Catovirus CTV1 TaxID=1977631 RepID=A0A1V0SBU8_9VIRU|nr:hypothetical protein Catovirus_2_128 [Catovirus CTV1]